MGSQPASDRWVNVEAPIALVAVSHGMLQSSARRSIVREVGPNRRCQLGRFVGAIEAERDFVAMDVDDRQDLICEMHRVTDRQFEIKLTHCDLLVLLEMNERPAVDGEIGECRPSRRGPQNYTNSRRAS